MKRILTFALCVAAIGAASAQKANVDQANKLSGKSDQLNTARDLIQKAMDNGETKNDARTYFVAGKIEFDAYDNGVKAKMINPDDPAAKATVMADELMKGYKYFLQALPLDSLPDAKGAVKPKFTKDIFGKITGHANDFLTAGADYYNENMYYPQAYEAFVTYAGLPASGMMGKMADIIPTDQVATAYFNAGLAAYLGKEFEKAANAFKQARTAGYEQPETYTYEIASWQAIASDESRAEEAQKNILEVAIAGNARYGIEQPLFINNMINSLVIADRIDDALNNLNALISANPDNAALYGLRGYVNDRGGKDLESENDYRKAVSLEGVDVETLKNASKKIFRLGTEKWNGIEGNSDEAKAARKEVKEKYWEPAKDIALRAKAMSENDSDTDTLLESINYVLETYFTK